MLTRPPEKLPTLPDKISTRPLKKFPSPPEKYHLYRKKLPPPEIILTLLKFLNPYPQKFLNPPTKKFLTPPKKKKILLPKNFSTAPPQKKKKFSTPPPPPPPPPPENFSHPPPRKFFTPPPPKISQPLPKNSQTPLKISQPHSKKYHPQKYVKRYLPPPPNIPFFSFSFYLFSFTFQKNLKISGGGLNPLNPPTPLKYALVYITGVVMMIYISIHATCVIRLFTVCSLTMMSLCVMR